MQIALIFQPVGKIALEKLYLTYSYLKKVAVLLVVLCVVASSMLVLQEINNNVLGNSNMEKSSNFENLNQQKQGGINSHNVNNSISVGKTTQNSDISQMININKFPQIRNDMVSFGSTQLYTYQLQAVGLPSGTSWSAGVYFLNLFGPGNTTPLYVNTSSSSSMTLHIAAGLYVIIYGIGTPDITREFIVPSNQLIVDLQFPELYASTFTETGIPANANYSLEVKDSNISYINHTNSNSMIAYLPNGTYEVYAGINDADIYIEDVTVLGSSITANLNFPLLYKVNFLKGSAPSPSTWGVELIRATLLVNYTVSYLFTTSGNSLKVFLPSGYYRQTDYINNTYIESAPFLVDSSSLNITVNFPSIYRVTFDESGLSNNLSWSIEALTTSFSTLGFSYVLSSSSNQLSLPDGLYKWTANSFVIQSESSGEFAVTGQSIVENVIFKLPTLHKVTFTETGLTPGVSWEVSVSNKSGSYLVSNTSYNSIMSLNVPDGNYNYTITEGAYSITKPFTISGITESFTISLPALFKAKFIESGLKSGASWSVAISNYNNSYNYVNSTFGSTMIALIPVGMFNYTLGEFISGYYFISIKTKPYPFTESGSPLNINSILPNLIPVTFNFLNLSAGYCWNLKVYNESATVSYSEYGTSNSLLIFVPEGSYIFSASEGTVSTFNYLGIYPTNQISIKATSFNVVTSSQTINVNFPILYHKVIYETGINLGTKWSISVYNSVGGSTYYSVNVSSGSSLSLLLVNGTYTYEASEGNYSVLSGTLNVTGTSTATKTLTFATVYSVTFIASMIPQGEYWLIEISKFRGYPTVLTNDVSNFINVLLPEGNYNYTAEFDNRIVTKSFTVLNSLTINIAFPWMYNLTFIETGLQSGTQWYVNFTNYYSGPLTSSTYTVVVFNGTYNYTVQTSRQGYPSKSGTALISGSSQTFNIVFGTSSKSSYEITFIPSGLPSGTIWYVGLIDSNGTKTLESGSGDITFMEYNGSYTYNVSSSNKNFVPSSNIGALNVSGKSISQTIDFSAPKFIIVFTEIGLPSTVLWFANLSGSNGTLNLQGTGNLTGSLVNGSYTFTVASSNKGYKPSIYNGKFDMAGSKITESVTFTEVKYEVSFNESGLPIGTMWMINITNGLSLSTINTSVSTALMNGTYTYSPSNNSLYYSMNYMESFTVSGHAAIVKVQYVHYSYIEGTIVPSSALVTINGDQIQVTSGVFNKSVTEGAYKIVVSESGYASYYNNVTISQPNEVLHITVNLTKILPQTSAISPSNILLYSSVGAIIVIIGAAGIILYIRKK